LQAMVKLLNFQIDHVHNSLIVTPILWGTVLHFCSTKTLLVNWMPWCPKFIACKLDAMMPQIHCLQIGCHDAPNSLLANWMPWCPKFIACKLDAMMYVCLKSSDDSCSWHDLLDWLPFATSTLSTDLKSAALRWWAVFGWCAMRLCKSVSPTGWSPRWQQQLFQVHVGMTLLLLYYFRVQTSSFV
jgi:hypothetical protein